MIKIRKFYFAWDEKKEALFLEDMSLKGFKLCKIGLFKYYFEPAEPKKRLYAADFRSYDQMTEDEYIQLYQDAGWTFIAKYGLWYYYINENDNINSLPTLFNDYHSLREKYKRLLAVLLLTGFPLYFQTLMLFPNIENGLLKGFYLGLRIFVTVLTPLHAYAVIRLGLIYIKLTKKIKE